MNDNPWDMPNPLNPNPAPRPEMNNNPLDANPAETTPLEEIVEEVQTISVAPAGSASDPMARPMEQAPVVVPTEPKKKKKTGLIIGIIIAAVVAIGCGVAAAILLLGRDNDPVAKAMDKLMAGDIPPYVAVDGKITVDSDDKDSPINSFEIDLKTDASTTSPLNKTNASMTFNFTTGDKVNFAVDEVYAANGDLYLKLDNVTGALEDLTNAMQNAQVNESTEGLEAEELLLSEPTDDGMIQEEDVELIEEAPETTDLLSNSLLGSMGIIETLDGEWIKISVDDIKSMTEEAQTDEGATCLFDIVNNANGYKNSLAEAYSKNQFISSTTENVTLASKSGQPVRRVVFDEEKAKGFENAMQNTALVKDLKSCASENLPVDTESLDEVSEMPDLYVEVDGDDNFSRLYFSMPIENSTCDDEYECDSENMVSEKLNLTVDLSFSYPSTIDVAEPTEYRDLMEIVQTIMTSLFMTPEMQVNDVTVVE